MYIYFYYGVWSNNLGIDLVVGVNRTLKQNLDYIVVGWSGNTDLEDAQSAFTSTLIGIILDRPQPITMERKTSLNADQYK